jgi:TfoX/Sxy family transcriptional regulator of competence genes
MILSVVKKPQERNMKIPRPTEDTKTFFKSIVPEDPRITTRLVFGNTAAFVNGNMFVGLWGNDVFVHLSDKDNQELLKNKGASTFEPMKGKAMKGYTFIPSDWRKEPEKVHLWVTRSLDFAAKLPKKGKKP